MHKERNAQKTQHTDNTKHRQHNAQTTGRTTQRSEDTTHRQHYTQTKHNTTHRHTDKHASSSDKLGADVADFQCHCRVGPTSLTPARLATHAGGWRGFVWSITAQLPSRCRGRHVAGQCDRVAKVMDSKSIGLCPQGLESPRCRHVQPLVRARGSVASTMTGLSRRIWPRVALAFLR